MTEVGTAAGAVRGTREDGVAVFRGIPFAAAPVGELRFAAPRPVEGWSGVRDALAFGPPPPQPAAFGVPAGDADGDDWLTVNVWTPDPAARLPVMVWIHGGGYTIGRSGSAEYDGRRLAAEAGVVLVTFNYRVAVEGFAQIAGAPPNRGLLDQVAALEWVRDNVTAFGGDPGRVTVFGESAGAGSIAALLAMPRAAGLFHRAAAMSVPGSFFAPDLAADIATGIADALGRRATVEDLAGLDPMRLVAAAEELTASMAAHAPRWGRAAHRALMFAPVVDGEVLPFTPWEALAAGAGRDVDLLVGHTRAEQRLFSLITGVLGQVTDEQATAALEIFAPDGGRGYREAFPDAGAEQLYELVHSDWLFRMPSLRLAEAQAQAQAQGTGRAYVCELVWEPTALGACHGLDVPLVFGNLHVGGTAMLVGNGAEAEDMSAQLRTAWAGFAQHGDPGWPAYDTEKRLTRVFDTVPEITAYPEEASRLIWQHHDFPVLPLTSADR